MDVFAEVAAGQRGYLRDAVLQAARTLGLPAALPGTAGELARRLGLRGARRLRRLLDALALFGFVRRQGELFIFSGEVSDASAKPVPAGGWGALPQVIRDDEPLPEASDPEALTRFHRHLAAAAAGPARELWELLPAEGPLVDLGGGFGAYTAAFLERHPGAGAILVDRPEVLRLAGDLPGVRLADRLPELPGAGTVLLANVLHLYGPEAGIELLRGARAALRPGGLLVIKDLLIEPDRTGPAEGVLFALNMALFTRDGDVHDPLQLEGFALAAGFQEPARRGLRCSPASIVLTARAP